MQAVTDAFGALALALCKQLDGQRLAVDLKLLANEAQSIGNRASAELIEEIARVIVARAVPTCDAQNE